MIAEQIGDELETNFHALSSARQWPSKRSRQHFCSNEPNRRCRRLQPQNVNHWRNGTAFSLLKLDSWMTFHIQLNNFQCKTAKCEPLNINTHTSAPNISNVAPEIEHKHWETLKTKWKEKILVLHNKLSSLRNLLSWSRFSETWNLRVPTPADNRGERRERREQRGVKIGEVSWNEKTERKKLWMGSTYQSKISKIPAGFADGASSRSLWCLVLVIQIWKSNKPPHTNTLRRRAFKFFYFSYFSNQIFAEPEFLVYSALITRNAQYFLNSFLFAHFSFELLKGVELAPLCFAFLTIFFLYFTSKRSSSWSIKLPSFNDFYFLSFLSFALFPVEH